MKLSHTLKLPTSQNYEMRYIYAEATEEDIPLNLRNETTYAEQWRILQFIVIQQATMSAVLVGLVPIDKAKVVLQGLSDTVLRADLYEKVKKYGMV